MVKRFSSLFLSIAIGLLAFAALLTLVRYPAGVAWAAPGSRPLATVLTVGGACGSTIQACIDAANPGDEVHIPAGLYTESLTVAKSISVTGDLSSTTIIHALSNRRVMTITQASVYLADVMLTGGIFTSTGPDYSSNCGGGLQILYAWDTVLQNVAIIGNTAYCGGGLGSLTSLVTLKGVDISGNTAGVGGGVSTRQISLDFIDGSIRNNIGTFLAGGIELQYGSLTVRGGQIAGNSTDYYGGGVVVFGQGAVFTQTGGSITGNSAKISGGGLMNDRATTNLLGGNIVSNSAPSGGGVASFSDFNTAQLVLSGGQIASNTAIAFGGGVYLSGSLSYFTQTAGSIEHNVALVGGGLYQEADTMAWLLGGQVFSNTASQGGGVAVIGPDSWFTQTGGQIADNAASGIAGGMYLGSAGSVTVSISSGSILGNSALQGAGGIEIDRGTLVITGSRLLSNTSGTGAGALAQIGGANPVLVTVANTCIAGNSPLTSVVNASGPTIDARGNWWGASNGPSGAGPGSGDSVSAGVNFSPFLTSEPSGGCSSQTSSFDLSVARAGNGAGGVTSSPSGIDCGSDCSETYSQGTVVSLTATPAVSSAFIGWAGACGGAGLCVVTMDQASQVTATFALNAYALSIGLSGNGSGNVSSVPSGIDCGGTCSHSFDYGTVVTLAATPAVTTTFMGWTGACSGIGACVVTMTQPAQVTGTFTLNSNTLTVGHAGNGSGRVTSVPAGVDCGGACSPAFNYGTVVTLTATPLISSTFAGWSGACGGAGLCVLTMTAATQVTATFSLKTYKLTVHRVGQGTGKVVSVPPGIRCGATCSYNFSYGVVVSLTAQPAASSKFVGWQGACTGKGVCVVTLTQAISVTARFSLKPPNDQSPVYWLYQPPVSDAAPDQSDASRTSLRLSEAIPSRRQS